jgi:hypothetical protein
VKGVVWRGSEGEKSGEASGARSLAHPQSEVRIGAKQQAVPLIHSEQLFKRLYAFALG